MEGTFSFLIINRMSVVGIEFEKNIKELHEKVYIEPLFSRVMLFLNIHY